MYIPITGRQRKDNGRSLTSEAAVSVRGTWLLRWKATGFTVLLYALFAEWFYPLQEVGRNIDLNDVRPFLVAVAIYLLIGLIIRSSVLSTLLYGMVALGTTAWMFGSIRVLPHTSDSWLAGEGFVRSLLVGLARIASALRSDINGWVDGKWLHTSGEFRTLLLLIGWAMLASSIQSLMLSRRTVLFFTISTIVYLFGFEWGFGLDVTGSIARTVGWGLLLSASLYLDEQLGSDTERSRIGKWPLRWLVCALLLSLAVVGLAEGMKQVYPWPKPSPFASFAALTQSLSPEQSRARAGGGSRAQRDATGQLAEHNRSIAKITGYSMDDSVLGGSLQDNDTEWFTAISPEPTYWRGESKSIYTGRGWEASQLAIERLDVSGALQPEHADTSQGWSAPFQQTVIWKSFRPAYPLLFGGIPERITSWSPQAGAGGALSAAQSFIRFDSASGRYSTDTSMAEGQSEAIPLTYQYDTRVFRFNASLLRSSAEGNWPEMVGRDGLQLPSTLPDRVRELGKRLAEGADSQYDKVRNVQQFLQQEYTYTKVNTAVPPSGRDFVDYFLFDARQGYCNHFSTAMAVLLRTQGIPTRWVKGFAPGEATSPGHYSIKGVDAHAWVEVYFDAIGWVPFEATPPVGVPGGDAASNPDVVAASEIEAGSESGEAISGSEQKLSQYRITPEVAALLNNPPEADTGRSWDAVRSISSTIARWWNIGMQSINTYLANEWLALRHLSADWKAIVEREGTGTAIMVVSYHVVTRMPLLLCSGAAGVLLLLFAIRYISRRHALQRRLRRLVQAQQNQFRMSRVQEMGSIAWMLVERKYGAKPCGMTWTEYVSQTKMSNRTGQEHREVTITERIDAGQSREAISQFVSACNVLFFAGRPTDQAVQQQFIDGCNGVLRDCAREKKRCGCTINRPSTDHHRQ